MIVSFVRAAILYPIVVFAVRLMGKRQIGELQPTELVITILISNIATLPLEDQDLPLLMGVIPVLSLVCFDVLMSWASLRWKKLRRLVSGSPKIIIRDGVIDQRVMAELRFSLDDLMTALRSNGVFDVMEVQFAVVETNGAISVYPRDAYRTVTHQDLQLRDRTGNPPEVLIADGCVSDEGLQAAGYTHERLSAVLRAANLACAEVFLLTVCEDGIRCLIRKERAK